MVKALLDTNILVDMLRKYQPAENWLASQEDDLAVTRAVWLEVLEGVHNQAELQRALLILNDFDLIELTVSDLEWATRQLAQYRLSLGIDAFDCLIAAPSYRLKLPLYTQNHKHFSPLLGKLAQKPY